MFQIFDNTDEVPSYGDRSLPCALKKKNPEELPGKDGAAISSSFPTLHTRDSKWPCVLRRQQSHLYAARCVMNLINLAKEKDLMPFTDADHVLAPLQMNFVVLLTLSFRHRGDVKERADSGRPLLVWDNDRIHGFVSNH